ncbi:MAG: DbpA RNA binding domain-containing protein [Treponema sp.]|nr:DbpA RNA binding domain-containing protein [Treponema sp.]
MYNKRNFEVNEDQTAAFLENVVNNVKSDVDVDSLADLAKLFKKNVPLSLRKYAAAYLLREALKHDHSYRPGRMDRNEKFDKGDRNKKSNKNDRNEKNPVQKSETRDGSVRVEKTTEVAPSATVTPSEERQPHPRVEIPEEQATTIFISIGRNRRVFPRDLVSLLINVGGLDRERIGNIKILANYSFVQLFTEDTEKAISALNDYEYRGRKLTVNLSRQKGEVVDDAVEAQSEEEAMSAEDAAAYAAAEKATTNEPFGN